MTFRTITIFNSLSSSSRVPATQQRCKRGSRNWTSSRPTFSFSSSNKSLKTRGCLKVQKKKNNILSNILKILRKKPREWGPIPTSPKSSLLMQQLWNRTWHLSKTYMTRICLIHQESFKKIGSLERKGRRDLTRIKSRDLQPEQGSITPASHQMMTWSCSTRQAKKAQMRDQTGTIARKSWIAIAAPNTRKTAWTTKGFPKTKTSSFFNKISKPSKRTRYYMIWVKT